MSSRLITPPMAMAVTLDEARTAARVDGSDLDSVIEIQVRAITEKAEHEMNRALITQAHVDMIDKFDGAINVVPLPLREVTSVRYWDASGVRQTLPSSAYSVLATDDVGRIELVPGQSWPATLCRSGAVEVEFIAGYGPSSADVPFAIKAYILTKVYEHFAPPGTPRAENVERFLDRYQVYR